MKKIIILGAGAWGSALAIQAYNAGNDVTIWSYCAKGLEAIIKYHENSLKLPGIKIPTAIKVSCDLHIVKDADILLLVTPAQVVREFLIKLAKYIQPKTPLIICSKGIEITTGKLLSEICSEILPNIPVGVLSGPNFAKEIALQTLGATSLAMDHIDHAQEIAQTLSTRNLKIEISDDIIGTQIGGSLKNVIAICAGIITGAKLGENFRAAMVTLGLQEIAKIGQAKGAQLATFINFSGVGDLFLCCMSNTSRNMKFGYKLGCGQKIANLVAQGQPLVEGYYTVKAIIKLTQQHSLHLPLFQAMYNILHNNQEVRQELQNIIQ